MHLRDVIQPAATATHVVGLCAQLVGLSGLLAWWAGMSQGDAVMLALMLGFIYLLVLLLWGFSCERRRNAWLLLGGLSLLAWGTPLLLQGHP